MKQVFTLAAQALVLSLVLVLGYRLGSDKPVKAAGDNFEFQLSGVNQDSALLVYQPANKTVYVYRGVTTGNANLTCSMRFTLTTPGGAIQRSNCEPGSLR